MREIYPISLSVVENSKEKPKSEIYRISPEVSTFQSHQRLRSRVEIENLEKLLSAPY